MSNHDAARAGAGGHPYHIVSPSPWPALGALAAFLTAFGAVRWWHGGTVLLMILGLALVLVTMFVWWRDVRREAQVQHAHTEAVRHGLRIGMGLFISSEVMFFVAFFWAFFNASTLTDPSVHQWPPPTIRPMDTWGVPFLNTLILLSSGLAVNWAHHALRRGNRRDLKAGLATAFLLGALFLILQAHEYAGAAFGFRQGIFPSVFYMATGFHGFHVLVGTCFLIVNFVRASRGDFTPRQHVGFEAAAWYWHFVDVVWIFLFVWVYWWGSAAHLPASG